MQITHEGLGEQVSAGGCCGGGGSRVKCIQGMHSVAALAAIKPLQQSGQVNISWPVTPWFHRARMRCIQAATQPPELFAAIWDSDSTRRTAVHKQHRETKPPRSLLTHVRCSKIKCSASETLSVGFEEVWGGIHAWWNHGIWEELRRSWDDMEMLHCSCCFSKLGLVTGLILLPKCIRAQLFRHLIKLWCKLRGCCGAVGRCNQSHLQLV